MAATFLTCLLFSLIMILANVNGSDFQYRSNQKLEDYCKKTGSSDQVDWNPDLIFDNVAFNSLCENTSGTFPNPCNCSQFIMCSKGVSYLGTCAASDTTSYLPFDSLCSYSVYSECPAWKSTWDGDFPVTCETVGQREWDPPLLLPAEPTETCGQDYVLCFNFTQTGTGTCEEGKAYSKAYFGCIDKTLCEQVDYALLDL